ncbi:HD domain-containing protein [bacterium]|nr:HD domain-containing protein [bacterium]
MEETSKIEKLEAFEEVVKCLSGAVAGRALYPLGHPTVLSATEKTYHILAKLLKKRKEFSLGRIENELVFEDISISGETNTSLKGFIEHLKERAVERISFFSGLKIEELKQFIETLSLSPKELTGKGGLSKDLSREKITSITCGSFYLPEVQKKERLPALSSKDPKELYAQSLVPIKELISCIKSGKSVDLKGVSKVIQGLVDNISFDKTALFNLALLKAHDDYTFTHALDVSLLNMAQGKMLGFKENILHDLGMAGILHDVGKEFVPGEILRKPSKLTEEEMEAMKKHPVDGAKLLRKTKYAGDLACIVAFEHHLCYDLSGYPTLSRKRKLNLASMITTISDHYDALTTTRPYKKSMVQEKALRLMLGFSGKIFEPILLSHFIRAIGLYKAGDSVKLDTGEIGIVHQENQDLLRPQVKIVLNKDGEKVSEVVELREKDSRGDYLRSILSKVDPEE